MEESQIIIFFTNNYPDVPAMYTEWTLSFLQFLNNKITTF